MKKSMFISNVGMLVIDVDTIEFEYSWDIYSRNIDNPKLSYNDIVTFGQKVQRFFRTSEFIMRQHNYTLRISESVSKDFEQYNPITHETEHMSIYNDRVVIWFDRRDTKIEIETVAASLIYSIY